VAAAEILHEGMTGSQDPRGAVALQAAHRPEPGFQPPVICFDRVTRVLLNGVQRRGDQVIKDPRVYGARSVVTSAGTVPARSAWVKNRRAAARSRRLDSRTSMTWPLIDCAVEKDGDVTAYRHYWELCVLMALRDGLRSGDVHVPGSRRYADPASFLLTPAQ
jgi:hypothetical protein